MQRNVMQILMEIIKERRPTFGDKIASLRTVLMIKNPGWKEGLTKKRSSFGFRFWSNPSSSNKPVFLYVCLCSENYNGNGKREMTNDLKAQESKVISFIYLLPISIWRSMSSMKMFWHKVSEPSQ